MDTISLETWKKTDFKFILALYIHNKIMMQSYKKS